MATAVGNTYPTLLDYAKREAPGGGIDEIIELLVSSNPILADASMIEGNLPTGNRTTQRTTDPTGSWRKLNSGVAAEKSTTVQMDDTCGMLEAYSKIDVDLAALGGNEMAFRASEDNAFITGLNDTMATALFYGNALKDPEKFHGLGPRYNLTTGVPGSTNVINGGGSGSDNTSIWLITWGPQTCTLMYPKGSQAGLVSEDLGKQLVYSDPSTDLLQYLAYVTRFQWKIGLVLRDFRFVTRIVNIDISDLTADAASGADIMDLMIDADYARPTASLGSMAQTFWYCNKTIARILHKQAMNKSNVNLTIDSPAGVPQVNFLGHPVHICDNIDSDEATIA